MVELQVDSCSDSKHCNKNMLQQTMLLQWWAKHVEFK